MDAEFIETWKQARSRRDVAKPIRDSSDEGERRELYHSFEE